MGILRQPADGTGHSAPQRSRALRVLLIGDAAHDEFHDATVSLARDTELHTAAHTTDAVGLVARREITPELIIVAQWRPGQFVAMDIDPLRRLDPLLPIVALLGSWCEGEMRSGQPWPANARVYWYEWPAWWHHQLAALQRAAAPTWRLPLTVTRDERLLAESGPVVRGRGRVAIGSATFAAMAAISDVVAAGGFEPVWVRNADPRASVPRIGCAVWDGGQLDEVERRQLRRFARSIGQPPILGLFDLPQLDVWRELRSLGVWRMLGKPYRIENLLQSLVTVSEKRQDVRPPSAS